MRRKTDLTIELGYTDRENPHNRLSNIVFIAFNAMFPLYVLIDMDAEYAPWNLHHLEGQELVFGWFISLLLGLSLVVLIYFVISFLHRQHGVTLEKSSDKVIFWDQLFFRHDYRLQDSSELNQVLLVKTEQYDSPYLLFLKKSADDWKNKRNKSKQQDCGILLGRLHSEQEALKQSLQVSSYLGFPLEELDQTFNDNFLFSLDDYASSDINISHRPLWLKPKVYIPSLLLGLTLAIYITPVWEYPFILALNPSFGATTDRSIHNQARLLRIYSANKLKSAQSDKAILSLLRIVNTVDAKEQTELMVAAMSSLSDISGIQIHIINTEYPGHSIALLNQWASNTLALPLDSNGGVLLWFDLVPDILKQINELAGPDTPESSWIWLGLSEFYTREDWLHWLGKAFNDSRPLSRPLIKASKDSFQILRAGESIPRYRKVVAGTVGEAIAIKFWTKLSAEERGGKYFPADFRQWWAGYAAKYHLPPLPESTL